METTGSNTTYYIYGLGLISRINPSNATHYYIYDYRGSTVAMVDATVNATVTHKYQYDDFGKVLQLQEVDFNPFRYVGKYGVMYEDSTLLFMRARYYDPTIGRFLSEDPIWSTNLYPYANNNPIAFFDADGHSAVFAGAIYGGIKALPGAGVKAVSSFKDVYLGWKYTFAGNYEMGNYYMKQASEKVWDANKDVVKGMAKGAIKAYGKVAKIGVNVYNFTEAFLKTYRTTNNIEKSVISGLVKLGTNQISIYDKNIISGILGNKITGEALNYVLNRMNIER